ncbi:hypothetical protein AS156_19640 [Bradyrhizobium macuxiense]|uniref:Uncharacterized protein n=1 Tax=Bradyrhizobium macuxiense TaxID=1755647 RepID=A0A109JEX9_9BRAD|nr:hypothetical protein [Bradyrhizobium macuxiense]KWV47649.1 hypothetical protein AS156_19640 [Bradyrhizobium macuxiense]
MLTAAGHTLAFFLGTSKPRSAHLSTLSNHALQENTGAPALRLKLSLCGHLGRDDEAKSCLRLLREVHSEPMVAAWLTSFIADAQMVLSKDGET